MSAARLTELGYSVLNYEELLAVNGAGGTTGASSGGSPGTPTSPSSSTPSSTTTSTPSNTSNTETSAVPLAEVSNGVSVPVGSTWNDGQNVTSPWGPRDSFETSNGVTKPGHNGMDYAAPEGTRINAVMDGTVSTVESNPNNPTGYGKYVIITHENGTQTLYGHQSQVNVTEGQAVVAGEKIGEVGTTGKSTGPHLHLGYDGNGDGIFSRTDNCDNPAALLYAGGD